MGENHGNRILKVKSDDNWQTSVIEGKCHIPLSIISSALIIAVPKMQANAKTLTPKICIAKIKGFSLNGT